MISLEYGAVQVIYISHGEMFRVHEKPEVISNDQENNFHNACCKEMLKFAGIGLTPSIIFYPYTDGQEEMVKKRDKRHMHDYVRSWIKWLHLGDNFYTTTHDSL